MGYIFGITNGRYISLMAVHKTEDTRRADGVINDAERRLLDSALNLFGRNGYDGTSIREIIGDAGVTRPVLYYYFKNKEDVFCRLVEAQFEDVCEAIDEILGADMDFRTKLRALGRESFARAERSPAMVRLLLQFFFSSSDKGIRLDKDRLAGARFGRIVAAMQQGIDAGILCGGDAPTLAMVFTGILDMRVMARVGGDDRPLTPAVSDELVELFLVGAASGQAGSRAGAADTGQTRK